MIDEEKFRIDALPIGTNIMIGVSKSGVVRAPGSVYATSHINAVVIGYTISTEDSRIAIGWVNKPKKLSEDSFTEVAHDIWVKGVKTGKRVAVSNIMHYKYQVWIPGHTIVVLAKPEILFPNQKCFGCELPAPHAKPNFPENKFACDTCKVWVGLEARLCWMNAI